MITEGIPFISKLPAEVNAEKMSAQELCAKLQKGYNDIEAGRYQDAATAFVEHRMKRKKEEGQME